MQFAVVWPLLALLTLGVIQAGLWLHGRNVAQRAAVVATDIARGSYGSVAEARRSAEQLTAAGGLTGVTVSHRVEWHRGHRRRGRRLPTHPRRRPGSAPGDRFRPPRAGDPAMTNRSSPWPFGTLASRRLRLDERGAVAAELAMAVPALLLVLGLLVAGGRLWFARTTVVEAANTAARAASLARTGGEASAAGRDAGRAVADHRRSALCLQLGLDGHRGVLGSGRDAGDREIQRALSGVCSVISCCRSCRGRSTSPLRGPPPWTRIGPAREQAPNRERARHVDQRPGPDADGRDDRHSRAGGRRRTEGHRRHAEPRPPPPGRVAPPATPRRRSSWAAATRPGPRRSPPRPIWPANPGSAERCRWRAASSPSHRRPPNRPSSCRRSASAR